MENKATNSQGADVLQQAEYDKLQQFVPIMKCSYISK